MKQERRLDGLRGERSQRGSGRRKSAHVRRVRVSATEWRRPEPTPSPPPRPALPPFPACWPSAVFSKPQSSPCSLCAPPTPVCCRTHLRLGTSPLQTFCVPLLFLSSPLSLMSLPEPPLLSLFFSLSPYQPRVATASAGPPLTRAPETCPRSLSSHARRSNACPCAFGHQV